MNRPVFLSALSVLSVLALTGCVDQPAADAKMAKGCEAAIAAMIAPKEILSIGDKSFADEQTEGSIYRRVSIKIMEKDGWLETEQTYSCLFAQEWGFLNQSHTALLEQLVIGDTIYGKKDGKIMGSLDDFMKLMNTADTAMAQ